MFCFYFREKTPGFSPVCMKVGLGFSQSFNHLHFLKSMSFTIIWPGDIPFKSVSTVSLLNEEARRNGKAFMRGAVVQE